MLYGISSQKYRFQQQKCDMSGVPYFSCFHYECLCSVADNAYDPDVAATELTIDKKKIKGTPVLAFLDNGKGMVPDKLYKMLR